MYGPFLSWRTLEKDLKRAILSRTLSEDELRAVQDRLKRENRKKKQAIVFSMAALLLIAAVLIAMGYKHTPDESLLRMQIVIFSITGLVIWAILYLTQLGIIKVQFNRAVKRAYPELADELKL